MYKLMETEQITTEWWVDQGEKSIKKSKYPETKWKWKPTKTMGQSKNKWLNGTTLGKWEKVKHRPIRQ